MGKIALTAESSDPEVVTADLLRNVIRLQGVSPGTATVTVTATDHDMLTAVLSFSVLVPNRSPEAHGAMPSTQIPPGTTAHWVLSDYFSEPDGQQLTYASASSNTRVASASVSVDRLTVIGRASGTTIVTITASDPGGLSATQQVVATVVEHPQGNTLLQDDFESEESLAEWHVTYADPEISQGLLWLTSDDPWLLGSARIPLSADEWRITTEMGSVNNKGWASLIMLMEHDRFRAYMVQIGADDFNYFELGETNYRLYVWDEELQAWDSRADWSGVSGAIKRLGEPTKVSLSVQGGFLVVVAGATELISIDLELAGFPSKMNDVVLGVTPLPGDTPGITFFEYVEVVGVAQAGPAMDRSRATWDLSERLAKIGRVSRE